VVELHGRKYGAELYDGRIRLVGQTSSTGRRTIDLLKDLPIESVGVDDIDREGSLYLAVPEKDAVIKRVKISPDRSLDPDKLAQFELVASLLDEDDNYYLESYEINSGRERLAVAYRRREIDQQLEFMQTRLIKPAGFKLRSWAMAAGYTNYCSHEGGRLVCLIDITDHLASYCFVEDKQPIHLGSVVSNAAVSEDDPASTKAYILDIVATVQYQMLTYDKLSQTVPLSSIIITGSCCREELAEGIENIIGIKTTLPIMRSELFSKDVLPEAHKYLVGLGLTAD